MKRKLHLLAIVVCFIIAAIASLVFFVTVIEAQDIVDAYHITYSQNQSISTQMTDDEVAVLLSKMRIAPIVTVAHKDDVCDCWQIWQADAWRSVEVHYSHYFDFGDSYTTLAPVPGGMLMAASRPRTEDRVYGDWHCVSAVVVDW